MFKERFLRGLVMSSLLLVSLTISSFTIHASPLSRHTAGSLYQPQQVALAQVSNTYHLDCFRRQYNFSQKKSSSSRQKDAANYYLNLS